MIAGLPGTGIGGLYYVLSALWMPIRQLTHGTDKTQWKLIGRQLAIAACVVVTMWLTGEVVGRMVAYFTATPETTPLERVITLSTTASSKYNMIRVAFICWTLGAIVMLNLVIICTRLGLRLSRRLRVRTVDMEVVHTSMPHSSALVGTESVVEPNG